MWTSVLKSYFNFEYTQFEADNAKTAREYFDAAPKDEQGINNVKYLGCYSAHRQQNLRAELERRRLQR
jgi:hypothetical protein